MAYEVIKISELEETDSLDAWFPVSTSSTPTLPRKIHGSKLTPNIDPTKTFIVDENYTGYDSKGTPIAPYQSLQDAIDAIPSGENGYVICVNSKLTSTNTLNIDKSVDIVSLVTNSLSGLNIQTSESIKLSGFSLPAININQAGYNLTLINCELRENFTASVTGSFNAENLNMTSIVGTLSFPSGGNVKLNNSRNISLSSNQNLSIECVNCTFKDNQSSGTGLSIVNHTSAVFTQCTFIYLLTDSVGISIVLDVPIHITGNKAYFIDCQLNHNIIDNANCEISSSYIRYTPQNYTSSGNTVVNHIQGIDEALRSSGASDLYITRDLTSDDYLPDPGGAIYPTSGTVTIIKTGKSVTIKYLRYYLNPTWTNYPFAIYKPSELGDLTDDVIWSVGYATDSLKRVISSGLIERYVLSASGRDYFQASFENKNEYTGSLYVYFEINTYLK